jgi:hypothetical protein
MDIVPLIAPLVPLLEGIALGYCAGLFVLRTVRSYEQNGYGVWCVLLTVLTVVYASGSGGTVAFLREQFGAVDHLHTVVVAGGLALALGTGVGLLVALRARLTGTQFYLATRALALLALGVVALFVFLWWSETISRPLYGLVPVLVGFLFGVVVNQIAWDRVPSLLLTPYVTATVVLTTAGVAFAGSPLCKSILAPENRSYYLIGGSLGLFAGACGLSFARSRPTLADVACIVLATRRPELQALSDEDRAFFIYYTFFEPPGVREAPRFQQVVDRMAAAQLASAPGPEKGPATLPFPGGPENEGGGSA